MKILWGKWRIDEIFSVKSAFHGDSAQNIRILKFQKLDLVGELEKIRLEMMHPTYLRVKVIFASP